MEEQTQTHMKDYQLTVVCTEDYWQYILKNKAKNVYKTIKKTTEYIKEI